MRGGGNRQTSGSAVADDSMVRYFEFMPFAETGQAYVEVLRVVLVRRAGDSVEYSALTAGRGVGAAKRRRAVNGPRRRDGARTKTTDRERGENRMIRGEFHTRASGRGAFA